MKSVAPTILARTRSITPFLLVRIITGTSLRQENSLLFMNKKNIWWLALVSLVTLGIVLVGNLGVGAAVGNFITNLGQSSLSQNLQPKQSRGSLSLAEVSNPSPNPLPSPELRYQVHNLPQAVVYSLEIPPNYQVKAIIANELQTLPRFASNQRITALLNGGFFDPQNQLTTSFVTSQGQLVADPRQNPRLINNPQLATYLDKILNRSELRLYICGQTKRYQVTNHNQPIPADCQLQEAIGGGPQLLPELTATEEGFLATENGVVVRDAIGLNQPNARTAVGIKANGDLVWIMVAQKPENPRNSGLSLPDLAKFMTQLGIVQALNLDGGSSSSFYYRGQTFYGKVNGEGDRVQRAVKSVLVLQETN